MDKRDVILLRIKKLEDYFEQNSINETLFLPEFECAKSIREKLNEAEVVTMKVAEDILRMYNDTNAGQHYNGSAGLTINCI